MGVYIKFWANDIIIRFHKTSSRLLQHTEIYSEVEVVITNKVFTDAYRGAGRPEASFTIERLVEQLRELNIDPIKLRKINLIKENQMPFTGPTGLVYDSGTFVLNLEDCLTISNEFL